MAEGMEKGKSEERMSNLKKLMDSARSMLNDGLSKDKVMLYTGLTNEQIDALL